MFAVVDGLRAAWARGAPRVVAMLGAAACFLAAGSAFAADLFSAGAGSPAYRDPVLCVLGDGTILAFCEGLKKPDAKGGRGEVVMRRSEDGGQSWSEEAPVRLARGPDAVASHVGTALSGPVCVTPDSGRSGVHLVYKSGEKRLFHTVSDDAGRTWGPAVEISAALAEVVFPWTDVFTGPGRGITASDGTLMAPVTLHNPSLSHEAPEIDAGRYRPTVLLRGPGKARWEAGGLVGPWLRHLREGSLVEAQPRLVLYHFRGTELGGRGESRSLDGGRTWKRPVLVDVVDCADFRGGFSRIPGMEPPVVAISGALSPPKAPPREAGEGQAEEASPDEEQSADQASGSGGLFVSLWRLDSPRLPRTRVWVEEGAGASDLVATSEGSLICVFERLEGERRGSVGLLLIRKPDVEALAAGR